VPTPPGGHAHLIIITQYHHTSNLKATFEVFISIKGFECLKHLRGSEPCVQNKIVKDICALYRRDDFLAKLCSGYAIGIASKIHYLFQIPLLVTYYQLLCMFTQSNTTAT